MPHKDDKNVLFLKYEDMKRDLPGAVSQIASFIGANLSNDVITKIADLTSFDKMKNDTTATILGHVKKVMNSYARESWEIGRIS